MNYFILSLFFIASAFSASAQTDTLSVYFEYDSDELTGSELAKLAEFNALENCTVFEIHSHCDSNGTADYNLTLAIKRYDKVAFQLSGKVPLESIFFGDREAEKSVNYVAENYRRVDVLYSTGGSPIESREPAQTRLDEKSELIVSFENFLVDSTQQETIVQLSILFYS